MKQVLTRIALVALLLYGFGTAIVISSWWALSYDSCSPDLKNCV